MSLWSSFTEFVERVSGEHATGNWRAEELRLASAALLIHAAGIDGHFDPEERRTLKGLLRDRYELTDADLRRLLKGAEAQEAEAVDLYRFTHVLCRDLDQEGRQRIIEMLWEVVMADRVVHEFEANLVWRAAELLGVSRYDRIRLRKEVAARLGQPDL